MQSSVVNCIILSAIANPDVQRRIRNEANGDARRAIRCIARIKGEVTPAQITHHLARISNLATTGVATCNPLAFAKWKTTYDDMVFCLPDNHRLPATYIAQDYRRAIVPLGHDFNMLVSTEIKIRNCDADPVETAAAIQMIADEQHLKQRQQGSAMASINRPRQGTQHAKQSGDPRKFQRNRSNNPKQKQSSNNTLVWNDRRRLCIHYGKDSRCLDGKHMDKDCPSRLSSSGRSLASHCNTESPDPTATSIEDPSHADSIMHLLGHHDPNEAQSDSSESHQDKRCCVARLHMPNSSPYSPIKPNTQEPTTPPPSPTSSLKSLPSFLDLEEVDSPGQGRCLVSRSSTLARTRAGGP